MAHYRYNPMIDVTLEVLNKYKGLFTVAAWAVVVWILMFADTRYMKTDLIGQRFGAQETRITKLENAQIETNIKMQFVLDGQKDMTKNQKSIENKIDGLFKLSHAE